MLTLNWKLTVVVVFLATHLSAQYSENIQSDRPGQAIGGCSVGKNILQIQAGLNQNGFRNEILGSSGNSSSLGAEVRFGLSERLEFGLNLAGNRGTLKLNNDKIEQNGLSLFVLRGRANFLYDKGILSALGIQLNVGLPILAPAFNTNKLVPQLIMVSQFSLTDRLGITTNFGISTELSSDVYSGFYIINGSYAINDKVSFFAEQYTIIEGSLWDFKFDSGFAYLVNSDLQLDVFGGYNSNKNNIADWLLSIGASWRIDLKSQKA